jgi:hypothetical protein
MDNNSLHREYLECVCYHAKKGHTCEDTFWRLLHEIWPDIQRISFHEFGVQQHQRPLNALASLPNLNSARDLEPSSLDAPILIVRRGTVEMLLDGHRRINKWKKEKADGPHRVLIAVAPSGTIKRVTS